MDIHFVKLHSSGRDYLLLDGFKNIPPGSGDLKTLAPMIIDRHRGVGGYGFLILHRGSHSPIAATMFEGNGEEREPSPDALLCVGRYAFDAGLLGKEHSWIETRERTAAIRVIDSRNISVNIGPPFHWDDLQELREEPGLDIDQSMRIKEKSYVFTPMELHGYHAVIFAFENRFNLATMGRRCSRHKGFPFQPQVEIVRVFSTDELEMRAWYPLYGEVSSSSSGSGAALVAAVIHGFSDREAFVHNRGGDLFIRWDESNNQIQVTGAVEYSFTGTYYWEPTGYTQGESSSDPMDSTQGDSFGDTREEPE